MLAISLITDIDVNLIFYVENKKRVYKYLIDKYKNEKEVNKYLNSYSLKEMEEKKWIILKDDVSVAQKALDLLDFLKISNFDNII